MSELEEGLDPQAETTPIEETTTPNDTIQPEETTEEVIEDVVEEKPESKVLEETLKEIEAKNKRYKEQLAGKDKLIESLRVQKLADSLQPQASEPEEDEYGEVTRVERPKAESEQSRLIVENAITNNEFKMERKYGNDPNVPWNEETKEEVYQELFKMDPSGKSLLRMDAIELIYDRIRGRKLSAKIEETQAQANKIKEQEIKKLKAKEIRKTVAAVETSTSSSEESVVPAIEDIVSGKVQLTSKQMVEFYPELFGPNTKKLLEI